MYFYILRIYIEGKYGVFCTLAKDKQNAIISIMKSMEEDLEYEEVEKKDIAEHIERYSVENYKSGKVMQSKVSKIFFNASNTLSVDN